MLFNAPDLRRFLLNLCLGLMSGFWTEPRLAGVENHGVLQPIVMTSKVMEIRFRPVVCELQVGEEGPFRVFSIHPEERRFSWILEVMALPDPPQRLGDFGNVHHGSLVRKLLMDTIHEHLILPAALGSEAYVQMPDVSSADVTDVVKPQENGEETATMFDEEHEAVVLVKESETLGARLNAGTKETGMDHYVLETVKTSSSLGVSSDREVATSRED